MKNLRGYAQWHGFDAELGEHFTDDAARDASPELLTAVEDYLAHAHAHDEPPWSTEFDEICEKAVGYANSKQERLRKHQRATAKAKAKAKAPALNGRHCQSLAQERHAIRQALRQPNSISAHRSMLIRLEQIEKLITNSKEAK